MNGNNSKRLNIFVGTHKGAFRFSSSPERKLWKLHGPFLKGEDVHHIVHDTRVDMKVYACVNSAFWGSSIKISSDLGASWESPESNVKFSEGSEHTVKRIWCMVPGNKNASNVLYAGVDPAALFRSDDCGRNWYEIEGLTNHSSREKWQPGAGGLMVHSVCTDPEDEHKVFVGISAAGTFFTEDGGATWEPRNKGILADFLPEKFPEVGQCVHHMESHYQSPELLYQQNHCGVYRSENGGREWVDISEGLPSRFGFPLVIHPNDQNTIFVIPEEGAEFRCPVNGEFAVYRSRNRGDDWQKLTNGLPDSKAYLHVFRQAMAVDTCQPYGIYVGTSTGQIFYSMDEGNSWEVLAQWLPPIFSLSCSVT